MAERRRGRDNTDAAKSPSKQQISAALGWLRGSLQSTRAAVSPTRRALEPSTAAASSVRPSRASATSSANESRSRSGHGSGPAPSQRADKKQAGDHNSTSTRTASKCGSTALPRGTRARPYGGPPPRRKHSKGRPGGHVVDAAALQDHLRRTMKLSLDTGAGSGLRRPRQVSSAPAAVERKARVSTRWDSGDVVSLGGRGNANTTAAVSRKRWKCARCGERNSSTKEECLVPKYGRNASKNGFRDDDTDLTNAVVITLRSAKPLTGLTDATDAADATASTQANEYYLQCAHCGLLLRDQTADKQNVVGYEPKLTLAMRRGLVKQPDPKLSDDQWAKIERMTKERGDHVKLCAICQQNFGTSEQIILSCSHIFHRKCLLSFERFVKSRQRRCCPICRKANYQKRISHAGFFDSRINAARAFQRLFRGYRERVAHDKRRMRLYQSTDKSSYNPMLRRKYIYSSVQNVSSKLETAVARREGSVETALAMADKALAASRSFFRTIGGKDGSESANGPADSSTQNRSALTGTNSNEDAFWSKILATARGREDDDCAICLCELRGPADEGDDRSSTNLSSSSTARRLVLLNCTHVFHEPCLSAYENFNVYDVQLCPTCRTAYRKRVMDMSNFFGPVPL